MATDDLGFICFIIVCSIVAIIFIVFAMINFYDIHNQIDNTPQLDCDAINSEMKLDQNTYVRDALEKEWFKKECWKDDLK